MTVSVLLVADVLASQRMVILKVVVKNIQHYQLVNRSTNFQDRLRKQYNSLISFRPNFCEREKNSSTHDKLH